MRKLLLISLVSIISIVLIALSVGSFYFYEVGVARSDKEFMDDNPDLAAVAAEAVPEADYEAWWDDQSFTDWNIESDDGLQLYGYYLAAAEKTDKTVIIAHGYSSKSTAMSGLAYLYHKKLGYNILLPDARGHGRSEGDYIGFGWHERLDYLKWIDTVIQHVGEDTQIVLHGVSMGGATVMMTSGELLPANVKAIVEDCGYTSAKDELSYQLKRMYNLPAFPIINTTSLLTKLRAGYYFGEASALKQVKKSVTPTLFIHGDSDLFVPTEMVYELYEASPVEKDLLIVKGAGHGKARSTSPEIYDRKVTHFLDKYIN